jgi:hypothetical protein
VDGRLLKYIKLDYTISSFEAIMPVDASERVRGEENLATATGGLDHQARDIKVD